MKKIVTAIILLTMSCQAQTPAAKFAKGADVSWLPQMEADGFKFYDSDAKQADCLKLLKDRGMDAVRLRVFVDPSGDLRNGHCSKDETVAMAVRAHKMGMRVMIDFHYSDSWADPAKQFKPKAWENHPFVELLNDVFQHTYQVLSAIKKAGVTPEWVQIGNEIPGGMLWPDGSTDNWKQLAELLNKGYQATKSVDKSIKVIVHVDEGNNKAKFRNFFDNATEQNVQYDVIGLSYYPFWIKSDYKESIDDLRQNLKDLASRYGKEVMVVEVGGESDKPRNTYELLAATIKAVREVPDNKGLGVFYWEPQGATIWSHYSLNAWQDDGKPSPALDAFKEN